MEKQQQQQALCIMCWSEKQAYAGIVDPQKFRIYQFCFLASNQKKKWRL